MSEDNVRTTASLSLFDRQHWLHHYKVIVPSIFIVSAELSAQPQHEENLPAQRSAFLDFQIHLTYKTHRKFYYVCTNIATNTSTTTRTSKQIYA